MALFAAETEKRKPQFLIVDTTEFAHRWAHFPVPCLPSSREYGRNCLGLLLWKKIPEPVFVALGGLAGILLH